MASSRLRVALSAAIVSVVVVGLSACVEGNDMPVPTYTPSSSASASPTAPADPQLVESGSAEENKPYFDFVNNAFYAANGMSDGRSIIDNLIAAGFRKQDMELTPDRTPLNLPADAILFSVRVKGECLVGQFGATGYRGIIAPLLGNGGCMVGLTRPIDW